MEKYFFGETSSQQISGKISEIKRLSMKNFSDICCLEITLNCRFLDVRLIWHKASAMKYEKKNLKVNNISQKICDAESTLICRSYHSYIKINTHNISY